MKITFIVPIARLLLAVTVGAGLLLAPATASAAPAPAVGQTAAAKPTKVTVKADKKTVKVGERVKLDGTFEIEGGRGGERALEVLLVQQLQAGVWVNLTETTCRPNGRYKALVSFSASVQTQLRVYYPGTSVYASATSQVVGLVVVN